MRYDSVEDVPKGMCVCVVSVLVTNKAYTYVFVDLTKRDLGGVLWFFFYF